MTGRAHGSQKHGGDDQISVGAVMEYIAIENTGRRSHARPIFRLTRSLHYDPQRPGLPTVTVPAEFHTEFGSVCRCLWRLVAPWDFLEPTAIHDYLCESRSVPRRMADWIFLCAMKDYSIAALPTNRFKRLAARPTNFGRRWLTYAAVRLYWLFFSAIGEI